MRSCFISLVAVIFLAGCVTETSSITRNKPNVRNEVNNQEAAKTRITLALQYLRSGNNSQAKYNLEKALRLAPELPQGHYSLAYYYELVGEEERAEKAYQKALYLDPDDPNTLNNYGTFLCRIGKYQVAREQLFKAIDVPSYLGVSRSYENLALCEIKQDNFSTAEDYLNSAIAHDGRSQSALIGLAALFFAKSDLHQAKGVLENYSDKGFISPRSMQLQYLVHVNMGHLQKAQEIADLLIQTYPESSQARALLNENTKNSEFVRLKEQYRIAQLKKITQKSPSHVSHQPKIKIKRKIVNDLGAQRVPNSGQSFRSNKAKFTAHSGHETTITSEQVEEAAVEATEQANEVSTKSALTSNNTTTSVVRFYEPNPNDVRFEPNSGIVVKTRNFSKLNTHSMRLINEKIRAPEVPFHIMAVGENVFSLSVKYDIKLVDLLRWNNLSESDKVVAGQTIYLNNPTIIHAIKAGDTLFKIATQHGLLIDDLMRWNDLTPDVALKEGHGLLIVNPDSYVL